MPINIICLDPPCTDPGTDIFTDVQGQLLVVLPGLGLNTFAAKEAQCNTICATLWVPKAPAAVAVPPFYAAFPGLCKYYIHIYIVHKVRNYFVDNSIFFLINCILC